MNTKELKDALRNGPYVWPGGYPCYFITADCEALSFDAVRDNFRLVLNAVRHPGTDDQWRVIGVDVNWEDETLVCAHTGEPIPSAYGEGEA